MPCRSARPRRSSVASSPSAYVVANENAAPVATRPRPRPVRRPPPSSPPSSFRPIVPGRPRQPDAECLEQIPDVPLVHLPAVRLADAIDELHLQRNDRHRSDRLRRKLNRTVRDRVVQTVPVDLGDQRSKSAVGGVGNRRQAVRLLCVRLMHDSVRRPWYRSPSCLSELLRGTLRSARPATPSASETQYGHEEMPVAACRIGERRPAAFARSNRLRSTSWGSSVLTCGSPARARERIGDAAGLPALAGRLADHRRRRRARAMESMVLAVVGATLRGSSVHSGHKSGPARK